MSRKGRGPGKYSRRVIAAVKAACAAGIPFKLVSKLSGVPLHTLRPWTMGLAHKSVEPDPAFRERFEYVGRKLFL